MQAGRELDAKVAEALGYCVVDDHRIFGADCFVTDDALSKFQAEHPYHYPPDLLPHFSTTWEGMGVLVEEAKKQGIYLEYSHSLNGGHYGGAYSFENGEYQLDHSTEQAVPTAPHAVALVYLMARGVIANA